MVYKYVAGKNNREYYYKSQNGKWVRLNNKTGEKRVKYYEKDSDNVTAAGIIVLRKFDGKFKLLALKGDKKYMNKKDTEKGKLYDIPKGRLEKGESPLQAALRETDEESSITELNFKWGLHKTFRDRNLKKQLVVFLAITEQDPKIKKNPVSGIYEHTGTKWVTWEEMKDKCYGYLKPVIVWGENELKNQ